MEQPKLLIVEDEQIVATELKERLHALGYQVVGAASTGPEAVLKAEELSPDLILMDIRLRGEMDGIEAAGRILASRDVPIVFVTAHADEATLQRAKVTGPVGYVLKPFSERELQTALEMGLYKHVIEKELKAQKQWLAALLDSIGDSVIATDTEGRITLINAAASSLTGFPPAESLGRHVALLLNIGSEATGMMGDNPVSRILEPGTEPMTTTYSFVIIARSGKVVPIDGTASRIIDGQGTRQGTIFAFRDVSAQSKQAEAARAVQFSVNQAPDLIFQAASDGLILEVNETMCTTLDYSREELLSKHAYELELYSSQSQWAQIWERAKREVLLTYETSYWTGNGAAVPVDVRIRYIKFKREEFLFTIARITDQTQGLMRESERSASRMRSV